MKWSAWFPYPQSWLRAVLQVLYLVPVGWFFRGLSENTAIPEIASRSPQMVGLLILGVIFLPFLAVAWGTEILVISRKPAYWPKGIPSPNSLWEGLFSILIMLLFAVFLFIFMLFYLPMSEGPPKGEYAALYYLIFSACMYQLDYLIRKGIEDTKDSPSQNTATTK
jgi:hypothetical protein